MPRLSDSMEEGTILRWLKSDGDVVLRGDPIAEIETDKATLTYEADAGGVLTIVAPAGEALPIGSVIARLNGAATARSAAHSDAPAPAPEVAPAPAATPAPTAAPDPPPSAGPHPAEERVKASPVARRIAREQGIDLHRLTGTGPGGRIVKDDVENAARTGVDAAAAPSPARTSEPPVAEPSAPAAPAPSADRPAPPPSPSAAPVATGRAKGEVSVRELTRTQQLIARRMAESKATVPEFTLRSEIDMEACVSLRAELKELGGEQAPSYNDMVVKAAALALREFPRANGSYRDGRWELHGRVNVGVAVAAPDALVVPTVFDADSKSLREIARETRDLAEGVRAGTIAPPQLSGGTFTVSNLGMYGVSDFTAIINPPQAAILAVGALAQRAVVRDGDLVARHTMFVTLVCDHRILYGADAAQFLARIGSLLERPLALAF